MNYRDPSGLVSLTIGGDFSIGVPRIDLFGYEILPAISRSVTVGFGGSFPVPYYDPNAELDFGVFGTVGVGSGDVLTGVDSPSALGGIGISAAGQVSVNKGSFRDLRGDSISGTIQAGTFGGGIRFSPQGRFTGVEASFGGGLSGRIDAELTSTLSIQDGLDLIGNHRNRTSIGDGPIKSPKGNCC